MYNNLNSSTSALFLGLYVTILVLIPEQLLNEDILMKLLFDFLPIVLFFIAFKMYDIYVATAVAIVASILQVATFWLKYRTVERMHIVTLILIVVLGGATLVLQDELFIKWKPTAINWAFALVFLGSQWVMKKPLIQSMMEKGVSLPDDVWQRLNLSWVIFFVLMGVANLYVMYYFDTNTWVNFKLFGVLGLTIAFVVAQALYLSKHIQHMPSDTNEKD